MIQKGLFIGCVAVVLITTGCTHLPVGNPSVKPQVRRVSYLYGKTTHQINQVLGKPIAQRVEEPNQLWSYYDKGCSTLVYFDGEGVCQYAEMRGTCERRLAMRF